MKIKIIQKPKIQFHTKNTIKILNTPKYRLNNYILTIPKNFISDGASIPPILWPFIGSPYTHGNAEPAIVHDALYAKQYHRKTADRIFLILLLLNNIPIPRAIIMYTAVRIFGKKAYQKAKKPAPQPNQNPANH